MKITDAELEILHATASHIGILARAMIHCRLIGRADYLGALAELSKDDPLSAFAMVTKGIQSMIDAEGGPRLTVIEGGKLGDPNAC